MVVNFDKASRIPAIAEPRSLSFVSASGPCRPDAGKSATGVGHPRPTWDRVAPLDRCHDGR